MHRSKSDPNQSTHTARRSRYSNTTSRRQFLRSATGGLAGLLSIHIGARSWAKPTVYTSLSTDRYLGEVTIETTIVDKEVFTEGPAVDHSGILYFTNTKVSKILRWDPIVKRLTTFRENSNEANGLHFDRQGRLLACEGAAGRVTRTDMKTGKIDVLADRFQGKKFAKPNDLCQDEQGRVYFTARTAVRDEPDETPKGVYRIDLDGNVAAVLQFPKIHMPNGIDTSPDNKTLYVIESHSEADHHRDIRAFDLLPNGSVNNERIVIDFYPGRSGDGMCVDAEGNLYVAAGLHKKRGTSETLDTRPGIHVIAPDGRLLGFRETPEDTITNCTFGGSDLRTLYVTCGTRLLSIPTRIPGKSSYRPES